jgi:hypothetical protein
MIRRHGKDGYALLAALVIMAIAAVFAATIVAAVVARRSVSSADAASADAMTLERQAVASACLAARRGAWAGGDGSVSGVGGEGAQWQAEWWRLPDASALGWPAFSLRAHGASGLARRSVSALVELRREPFAQGPVVSGDVQLDAPLIVNGAGVYSGGCVRGREWVTFPLVLGMPAVDGVHGEQWPLAGVHALGGIWSRGDEEHSDASAAPATDTDTHSAVNEVMSAVTVPSQDWWDTARSWAEPPGSALEDGVLRLDRLPAAVSALSAPSLISGVIVWLSRSDSPVRVLGERPPGWCPVLVVSVADVTFGGPSMRTGFTGAVVAGGRLEIEGDTTIEGGLYAGTLDVAGSLDVETGASWRTLTIPGLIDPVIVGLDTALPAGN